MSLFDSLGITVPSPPSLGSALGSLGINSAKSPGSPTATPWNSSNVQSTFFPSISIDTSLWDKVAPYRLVVYDVGDGKNKKPGIVGGGNDAKSVEIYPVGNMSFAFKPLSAAWVYNLPITPQQLTITDQFAINTSATLRGVVEEHSGIRFKNISINGTFGVWQRRANVVKPPAPLGPLGSILQSVFGGTIAAAQNVATQFQSVINAATTGNPNSKPKTIRPGGPEDPDGGLSTGWVQAQMCEQFLEQYAEAKKDPSNATWRLVFDIPKQKQSFVVTPMDFRWIQNVNRPNEVNFSLQLKAWRRIDLQNNPVAQPSGVTPLTPGILQRILATISAARNTAAASYALIGSVRSDVDNVLNIVRQTGLLVKDLAGVALAIADLPTQLQQDCASVISQFLSTFNSNNLTGNAGSDSKTLGALANIQSSYKTREGLSMDAVSSGQLGAAAASAATIDPSANVFSSVQLYPLLMDQVPVNSLTLNVAQQNALTDAVDAARALTVNDLKGYRGIILDLCTQLTNSFGAGDAYYSKVYGKNPPTKRIDPMTLDEYDIVQGFYDLLDVYDTLTATKQLDENRIASNMEYVKSLADSSSIEFSIPNSKLLVPVPFGLSMEGIALRYLGDVQRWLEIATLNNLREPYIDENGFRYNLLSNGTGRQITVGNSTNLYIGQKILIVSSVQGPTARTVLGIDTLSESSFLVTLDGLANLDSYKTVDGAYLQAYLPGTTNSQNNIFIPSNAAAPADDMISIPASVAAINLVGLSKVDLLLTDSGDLAINSYGDFRWAAGMTNLIQALKIKFGTPFGSVYLHPTFGFVARAGSSTADLNAKTLYNQINTLVTADPRFAGISGLQVQLAAPTLGISMGVGLAGLQGVFPVNFQLPTY